MYVLDLLKKILFSLKINSSILEIKYLKQCELKVDYGNFFENLNDISIQLNFKLSYRKNKILDLIWNLTLK